jgi:hypothetical protein
LRTPVDHAIFIFKFLYKPKFMTFQESHFQNT